MCICSNHALMMPYGVRLGLFDLHLNICYPRRRHFCKHGRRKGMVMVIEGYLLVVREARRVVSDKTCYSIRNTVWTAEKTSLAVTVPAARGPRGSGWCRSRSQGEITDPKLQINKHLALDNFGSRLRS